MNINEKCGSPAAFEFILCYTEILPLITIITLFIADLLPFCNRLFSNPARTFSLLVQQNIQLLCSVEDPPGALATRSTRRGFPVPL